MRFTQHRFFTSILLLPLLVVSLCLPGLLHAQAQQRSTFSMPSIVGLTVEQADARVLAAGRVTGALSARAQVTQRVYDNRPAGQIVRQLQTPGTRMRPYMDDVGGVYGQVSYGVVVSRGARPPTTFPMPDVVGMTVEQAERAVLLAGRNVNTRSARAIVRGREADDRPAGVIIRQLQQPGTQMRPHRDDVGGVPGEVQFSVDLSTGPLLAPEFIGKPLTWVDREAQRQGIQLEVGSSRSDPRVAQGIVIHQEPEPGAPTRGRRVTVYPSDGFPLPSYVGRTSVDAERDARRLGFALQVTEEDNLVTAPGIIFEQYPAANSRLPFEEPVRITISQGWPMPDYVQMTVSDASLAALELRLQLRPVERENPGVPVGVIFSQSPEPGRQIPEDRVITVEVSAGLPLPNLVGSSEAEAHRLARELGFSLAVRSEELPHRDAGEIDSQTPPPGTLLPLDESVRIRVSAGWPIPDFVGMTLADARLKAAEISIELLDAGTREDFDLAAGLVVEQVPAAGNMLPPDRQVEIILSEGWPIAPNAVGQPVQQVRKNFLARHRDVRIVLTEDVMSLEAAGTVIAQSPSPGVKLSRDKRLALTVASAMPAWLWSAVGTFVLATFLGAVKLFRPGTNLERCETLQSSDTGGIRLRVLKDPGLQKADYGSDTGADDSRESAVNIRVKVDLGEQSAGPVEDEGGQP